MGKIFIKKSNDIFSIFIYYMIEKYYQLSYISLPQNRVHLSQSNFNTRFNQNKMKLTLNKKSSNNQIQQLIDLSCRTHLTRICSQTHDIKHISKDICQRYHLPYTLQLGSIFAHATLHFSPNKTKRKNSDIEIVEEFLNKYQTAFFINKQLVSNRAGIFQNIQQLVNFGVEEIFTNYQGGFIQSIPNKSAFRSALEQIIKRHLSSFFFQSIPNEYSYLLFKIYLERASNQDEEKWFTNNKNQYKDINPYHHFFQILQGLNLFLLRSKNAVDSEHYLQILSNPSIAQVDWSMVLGIRGMYKLNQ